MAKKVMCKYCKAETGFSRFLDVSTSKDGVYQRIACEKCQQILLIRTMDSLGNEVNYPFPK